MATRYYLRRVPTLFTTASLPSSEQSPDVPSRFSYQWGISGNVPPLRNLDPNFFVQLPNAVIHSSAAFTDEAIATALVTGTFWSGWWRTQPFATSSFLSGGTIGFYHGHQNVITQYASGALTGTYVDDASAYYRGCVQSMLVYQWRPGVGKISTLVDRVTSSFSPFSLASSSFPSGTIFSQSFPYSSATLATGDLLIYEVWVSASLTASITGTFDYSFFYEGPGFTGSHNQSLLSGAAGVGLTASFPNHPASWIEFTENLPAFQSSSFVTSSVYISDVRNHPTDSNKLRVTFSAPIHSNSITSDNFAISPSSILRYAAAVPGAGNAQIDLHFGSDIPASSSTVNLWRFDELVGSTAFDSVGTVSLTTNAAVITDGCFKAGRNFALGNIATSANTLTPRSVLLGEWTLDALFKWVTGDSFATVVSYSGLNNATEAENYLLGVFVRSDGRIESYWESGSNVAHQVDTDDVIRSGDLTLVTVRKSLVSGTNGNPSAIYKADVFINRRLSKGSGVLRNSSGATSVNTFWRIGDDSTGLDSFSGTIDTIRFSSGAMSDSEILSLRDILFPFVRGQVYTLFATGVVDPSGSMVFGNGSTFRFQYLGHDAVPLSGTFDVMQVPHSASINMSSGQVMTGSIHQLDMLILYDSLRGGGVVFNEAPTITGFSPSVGSQITSAQPISFNVVDDGVLRRVIITVKFPNHLIQEVIHDGDGFGLSYMNGTNVRTVIPGGYNYVILRDGGWLEDPTIIPFAIDVTGSENF